MAVGTSDRRRAKRAGTGPRRVTARSKTLKSAKIIFNKRQSVIDCFVRDLSPTGAKLSLGDLMPVPRTFTLELHDGTSMECERVRAMGKEIGVRFLK
ncbi:PilZ domain-containing protein [Dongia sedimenti]|uniref:PilZ domain-containing protein n=1 Tax=Dongia sedimenti TaxID=3064282 RepID=A0ABU0YNJ3_9PROT|nr:PilZ domain-containing protein [Rhodospirillaceae bacterium R-7]